MLTAKQEKFARLIALEGYTQHDAYLAAYDVESTLPETINPAASKLANDANVGTRIAELRQLSVQGTIASKQERLENASDILRTAPSNRDKLQANRLIGDYQKDFVTRIEQTNINLDVTELVLKWLDAHGLADHPDILKALESGIETEEGSPGEVSQESLPGEGEG